MKTIKILILPRKKILANIREILEASENKSQVENLRFYMEIEKKQYLKT